MIYSVSARSIRPLVMLGSTQRTGTCIRVYCSPLCPNCPDAALLRVVSTQSRPCFVGKRPWEAPSFHRRNREALEYHAAIAATPPTAAKDHIFSHMTSWTLNQSSFRTRALKSPVSFPDGNGSRGHSTPRKLHSGSQPSLT